MKRLECSSGSSLAALRKLVKNKGLRNPIDAGIEEILDPLLAILSGHR